MDHERILGVFAHPDDADVGSGGTLAKFVEQGAHVSLLVATAGDAGGFKAEGQDQIAGVRMKEQRAAAAQLGITDVTFLGHMDGELRVTSSLVRDIVAQIRIHQPTLVITMSPEHNWTNLAASHPDHRAVMTTRVCVPATARRSRSVS
ncbi:MAG: PIG-L deacetylase family protein, partial [Ancrocorticia sp.]|uniref:PIG-L deacetylase family protein n=1 Tax=Ancrocorticia sp. TaxID=2593684 RepID=UPI003F93BE2C